MIGSLYLRAVSQSAIWKPAVPSPRKQTTIASGFAKDAPIAWGIEPPIAPEGQFVMAFDFGIIDCAH